MLKNRESEIEAIVAVDGNGVLAPCGRCRELMAQINGANLNSHVVLSEERVVILRDLLPEHWLITVERA